MILVREPTTRLVPVATPAAGLAVAMVAGATQVVLAGVAASATCLVAVLIPVDWLAVAGHLVVQVAALAAVLPAIRF